MSPDTWHPFSQPVRARLSRTDHGLTAVWLLAWRGGERHLEYLTSSACVFGGDRILLMEDHNVSG